MEAATVELPIYVGATLWWDFAFQDEAEAPVPFPAGTKAYLQVRESAGSTALPWLSLSTEDPTPTIVIDTANGVLTLHAPPAALATIPPEAIGRMGYYNLLVQPGDSLSDLLPYLEGPAPIRRSTTQVTLP